MNLTKLRSLRTSLVKNVIDSKLSVGTKFDCKYSLLNNVVFRCKSSKVKKNKMLIQTFPNGYNDLALLSEKDVQYISDQFEIQIREIIENKLVHNSNISLFKIKNKDIKVDKISDQVAEDLQALESSHDLKSKEVMSNFYNYVKLAKKVQCDMGYLLMSNSLNSDDHIEFNFEDYKVKVKVPCLIIGEITIQISERSMEEKIFQVLRAEYCVRRLFKINYSDIIDDKSNNDLLESLDIDKVNTYVILATNTNKELGYKNFNGMYNKLVRDDLFREYLQERFQRIDIEPINIINSKDNDVHRLRKAHSFFIEQIYFQANIGLRLEKMESMISGLIDKNNKEFKNINEEMTDMKEEMTDMKKEITDMKEEMTDMKLSVDLILNHFGIIKPVEKDKENKNN